jgi:hypothetical protein
MRAARSLRRRSTPAVLAGLAASLTLAGLANAQAALVTARLIGQFQMAGRVTVAKHISGEHRGDTVLRTWALTPLCPNGPCASVQLIRQRSGGSDTLVLHQTAPNSYAGTGRFYAPLRCGRRIDVKGESVPFTIKLQVTATVTLFGVPVASAVSASYTNQKRINRTRCVAAPGHDAALYEGRFVSGPPPASS